MKNPAIKLHFRSLRHPLHFVPGHRPYISFQGTANFPQWALQQQQQEQQKQGSLLIVSTKGAGINTAHFVQCHLWSPIFTWPFLLLSINMFELLLPVLWVCAHVAHSTWLPPGFLEWGFQSCMTHANV